MSGSIATDDHAAFDWYNTIVVELAIEHGTWEIDGQFDAAEEKNTLLVGNTTSCCVDFTHRRR